MAQYEALHVKNHLLIFDFHIRLGGRLKIIFQPQPMVLPHMGYIFHLSLGQGKSNEIFDLLKSEFVVSYDETQAIGKRYRRADAIGTPFAITVDDDTLENNVVTVRDRDTMTQEKVNVNELKDYLRRKLEF